MAKTLGASCESHGHRNNPTKTDENGFVVEGCNSNQKGLVIGPIVEQRNLRMKVEVLVSSATFLEKMTKLRKNIIGKGSL